MLLLENLYGDIVSDLCGRTRRRARRSSPARTSGTDTPIFEAVHGTAPDIAGKNLANPTALLMSAILMLRHLDFAEFADRVETRSSRDARRGSAHRRTSAAGGYARVRARDRRESAMTEARLRAATAATERPPSQPSVVRHGPTRRSSGAERPARSGGVFSRRGASRGRDRKRQGALPHRSRARESRPRFSRYRARSRVFSDLPGARRPRAPSERAGRAGRRPSLAGIACVRFGSRVSRLLPGSLAEEEAAQAAATGRRDPRDSLRPSGTRRIPSGGHGPFGLRHDDRSARRVGACLRAPGVGRASAATPHTLRAQIPRRGSARSGDSSCDGADPSAAAVRAARRRSGEGHDAPEELREVLGAGGERDRDDHPERPPCRGGETRDIAPTGSTARSR